MTTDSFFQLSPSALKALKSKSDTLEIRWKPRPAAEYIVLDDKYPKQVSITFFGLFKEQFPALSQTHDLGIKPQSRVVILVGADVGAIRKILAWAVSCCDGRGLSPFPFAQKENRYTLSYLDRQAAALLQITWLNKKIDEHMQVLEGRFIHPADARLLIQQLPHTDAVFTRLVNHIANSTWSDMQQRRALREGKHGLGEAAPGERLRSIGFVPLRKQYASTLGVEVNKIINAKIDEAKILKAARVRIRNTVPPLKPPMSSVMKNDNDSAVSSSKYSATEFHPITQTIARDTIDVIQYANSNNSKSINWADEMMEVHTLPDDSPQTTKDIDIKQNAITVPRPGIERARKPSLIASTVLGMDRDFPSPAETSQNITSKPDIDQQSKRSKRGKHKWRAFNISQPPINDHVRSDSFMGTKAVSNGTGDLLGERRVTTNSGGNRPPPSRFTTTPPKAQSHYKTQTRQRKSAEKQAESAAGSRFAVLGDPDETDF